jgi:hypothetical protein
MKVSFEASRSMCEELRPGSAQFGNEQRTAAKNGRS